MENLSFKEIEKKFNDAVEHLVVRENPNRTMVKQQVFDKLKSDFPLLELQEVDYNYNKFRLNIGFSHDFNGIKKYGEGTVALIFSIKSKRTNKLEKVSKTTSKYIHEKSEKPISFAKFSISSYVSSFDWENDDKEDLVITSKNWKAGNPHAHYVKGNTINELLQEIPKTYEKQFRTDIVQPYLKQLFVKGNKEIRIRSVFPKDILDAIDEKGNSTFFEKMAEFIIDNKMYK